MRQLTDQEIGREVHDITTRPWPLGDVLPLKNLYGPKTGVLIRKSGVPIPTVGELSGERHEFSSLDEMVRAGWVVD